MLKYNVVKEWNTLPTFRSRVQFPSPAPVIMDDIFDLHDKNCIPCKGGMPPFAISEIHKYLKKIDGWDIKKKEGETYFLEKNFTFKNFSESQKFVNQVSDIAEKERHHPDIMFGWGYAKIQIFTHKIKGLVESDFILAAKIDKINN